MSVEFGIITSVVPPGSWHYPQLLSSGQTVRLAGHSFEHLLEQMLDFRRRHLDLCGAANATIERVRADLKEYLCSHFPQNCADSPGSPSVTSRTGISVVNYQKPIDRASDWLGKLGALPISRVDAALAASRAQICATCPQNVRWQTSCAPCNDNVNIRIQNAKGSAYTPYDKSLGMCRIFGTANEVAVWLSDTHSSSDQKPPAVCWHND